MSAPITAGAILAALLLTLLVVAHVLEDALALGFGPAA